MIDETGYQTPLYRPPSESESLIVQAVPGCPHNGCVFCGMYKNRSFKKRDISLIEQELEEKRNTSGVKRVFIADADPLYCGFEYMNDLLDMLCRKVTDLARVSAYANFSSLIRIGPEKLGRLREKKLRTVYTGLESGSDDVLKLMNKKENSEDAVEASGYLRYSNIKLSTMVLTGLGGKKYSDIHISETVKVLNRMQPDVLAVLNVYPVSGTILDKRIREGRFFLLETEGVIQELKKLLRTVDLKRCVFRSDHHSNPMPLRGRLPGEKEKLLCIIEKSETGRNF
ncbi:MAG: radical SAM protein [Fibrobacterota bacterium]